MAVSSSLLVQEMAGAVHPAGGSLQTRIEHSTMHTMYMYNIYIYISMCIYYHVVCIDETL